MASLPADGEPLSRGALLGAGGRYRVEGPLGQIVTFQVGARVMTPAVAWDNSRVTAAALVAGR